MVPSSVIDWILAFTKARVQSWEATARVVIDGLTQKLAPALGIPVDEVDEERHFASLGVDSLLAIELRSWISLTFSVDVAVLDITGAESLKALAALIVQKKVA